MGEFKELLNNPTSTILLIFVLIISFKWLYELVDWYKGLFTKKHKEVNEAEQCHQIVLQMQAVSQQHTDALIELTESIKHVREDIKTMEGIMDKRFEEVKAEINSDMISMGRGMLYQLYEELKHESSLTMAQYETFKHVADIYLNAGGNGAFRNRLIKEILDKPIQEEAN